MLLSQKLYPKTESYTAPVAAANFIKNVLSGNARKDFGKVIGKATEEIIPNELLNTMKDFYQMEVGVMGLRAESVQFQKAGSKKMVRYSSCESSLSRKNSSVVAVLSSETLTLGIIDHLYVHEVASGTFYWAVLNLLCDISVERGVYKGKNGKDQTIVQLKDLSRPLVSVVGEDDYIYVLNCV